MTYRAPVRDLALSLQIAGHPALVSGAFAELDDDTVAAVLEAAGAFTEEQLVENFQAALDEILRLKPATSKGRYILKATMATTMGPGIPVDVTKA